VQFCVKEFSGGDDNQCKAVKVRPTLRKEVDVNQQLALPLEVDKRNDDALRLAWAHSRLPVPYHIALQNRALAICLRGLADAMRRRSNK
jgi:hypothetical protein